MEFKIINSAALMVKFISAWEVAFQRTLDRSVYNWVFNAKNKVFGVIDDDTIVAGYCLMEFDAIYHDVQKKGLLCNNVFVNGYKYQKFGLFDKLTEYSINEAKKDKYDFAVGFPNEKAIKSHLRSGWNEGPIIHFYELDPNFIQDEHIDLSNKIIEWYSSKDAALQSKLPEISNFYAINSHNYSYSSFRSNNFVAWRYLENPRYSYDFCFVYDVSGKLTGVFICKYYPANKKVHLVDYIINNNEHIKVSIKSIIKKYNNHEIDVIDCWVSKSDSEVFTCVGFKESERFTYCISRGIESDFRIDLSSHIVLGDNDVY